MIAPWGVTATDSFNFVFSLFGLLIGFSLVEVLGGLARTLEARMGAARREERAFHAGWLTPLLGLFVMLDVLSFWGSAWVAREHLSMTGPVLLGGLFFAGSYYLAAHLIFPGEPTDWPDLDDHYFLVRRPVFAAIMILATVQATFFLTLPGFAEAMLGPVVLISAASFYALLLAGLLVRGRTANIIVLTLLSVRYLIHYLI